MKSKWHLQHYERKKKHTHRTHMIFGDTLKYDDDGYARVFEVGALLRM